MRDGTHADKFLAAVAADLVAHRGASVVAVGPQQPAEVHAAVHRLNALLGNVGKTVRYTQDEAAGRVGTRRVDGRGDQAMPAGQVDTLLILGGNPVYDAPADLDFAGGLKKVADDASTWVFIATRRLGPASGTFRRLIFSSRGGMRARLTEPTASCNPLIAPLLWRAERGASCWPGCWETCYPSRRSWCARRSRRSPATSTARSCGVARCTMGCWPDSAWPDGDRVPTAGGLAADASLGRTMPENGQLELVFCRDASVYDGRFANNGWLQECPDPLTKLTWDNAALIGPADRQGAEGRIPDDGHAASWVATS